LYLSVQNYCQSSPRVNKRAAFVVVDAWCNYRLTMTIAAAGFEWSRAPKHGRTCRDRRRRDRWGKPRLQRQS